MHCTRLHADSLADSLANERASDNNSRSRGQGDRSASMMRIRQLADVFAAQIASLFAGNRSSKMRSPLDTDPARSRGDAEMTGKMMKYHASRPSITVHLHGNLHMRASQGPGRNRGPRLYSRSGPALPAPVRSASFDALRVTSRELNAKKQISPTFNRRTSEDVSCQPESREPSPGTQGQALPAGSDHQGLAQDSVPAQGAAASFTSAAPER
jgi:hypothetical protein